MIVKLKFFQRPFPLLTSSKMDSSLLMNNTGNNVLPFNKLRFPLPFAMPRFSLHLHDHLRQIGRD